MMSPAYVNYYFNMVLTYKLTMYWLYILYWLLKPVDCSWVASSSVDQS